MARSILLGHGASGDARSMRPWVDALAVHGVVAHALHLPKGRIESAMRVFEDSLQRMPDAAVGGHSYGGRAASLVAAERQVAGLVLLSYPLHRPGHSEELRVEHWPRIRCPVLLLSGDRDPFARANLLQREARRLFHAELHIYPGLGHGLMPVRDEAATRIARFLGGL